MLVLLNSKKDDSAINGRQKYERNRSQSFGKIKSGATQRKNYPKVTPHLILPNRTQSPPRHFY
jgi:hypothetical protein